jgi:hypothetical protein
MLLLGLKVLVASLIGQAMEPGLCNFLSGILMPYRSGLKAIQNPQGKSRGRRCRHRSPDKTSNQQPSQGGVFAEKSIFLVT